MVDKNIKVETQMMNKKGITFFVLLLLLSITASAIFTYIDFVIHKTVGEIGNVNKGYFLNKFLFSIVGFGLGFGILKFIPTWIYSILFGILLQLRYLYVGYPAKFHLIFIPLHILIIYFVLIIGKLFI